MRLCLPCLISRLLLLAYLKIIFLSKMPYNILPLNIRAVFNYKFRTTFTWIMEKAQKTPGRRWCQFICDLYCPSRSSCAIFHLLATQTQLLMEAEEPHTHKPRLARYQMKDRIDVRRAKGQRGSWTFDP